MISIRRVRGRSDLNPCGEAVEGNGCDKGECGEETNTGGQEMQLREIVGLEGTRKRVMMDSGAGAEISLMQAKRKGAIVART